MNEHVLIVDDEPNMRWVLTEALSEAGYIVKTAGSGEEALNEMSQMPIDLVILDLKMKAMDGLATLRRLRERWPDVVVLILTAHGTVATAVEAMQLGAADYLRKPFDVEEIRFKIHRALERKAMQDEIVRLKHLAHPVSVDVPTGTHPAWQRCIDQVRSFTTLDLGILFEGEQGSGRATLARFAYHMSKRNAIPKTELDASALPADQQPILFGQDRDGGIWGRTGAGTLLLRNVEHLYPATWASLVERIRHSATHGARPLLTATRHLPDLASLPLGLVQVPPLRERPDDIAILARLFAADTDIALSAMVLLEGYNWPGNISELRGIVERAKSLASGGSIEERHLPEHIRRAPMPGTLVRLPLEGLRLEEVEIDLIRQALEQAGGNKSRAAELLGLTRHTLLYRLEKYGLG